MDKEQVLKDASRTAVMTFYNIYCSKKKLNVKEKEKNIEKKVKHDKGEQEKTKCFNKYS